MEMISASKHLQEKNEDRSYLDKFNQVKVQKHTQKRDLREY